MDIEQMAKNEVKEFLKLHGGNTVKIPNNEFQSKIDSLSLPALEYLLNSHRNNRNFYKKILDEPYRQKSPNGWRYKDAAAKVELYNFQGKTISQLVKARS